MASFATFSNEVAALPVTGVVRAHTYPPNKINTADLPASFPRPPSNTHENLATCDSVNDTFSIQLVVAIEPTGQSTQPSNYSALLTMLDNVNAALKAASFTDLMRHAWVLQAQDVRPIIVGGSAYWGVTANITARGAN